MRESASNLRLISRRSICLVCLTGSAVPRSVCGSYGDGVRASAGIISYDS